MPGKPEPPDYVCSRSKEINMQDDKTPEEKKAELPGNKGQFGAGDATEAFKPLENQPSPDAPGSQGPRQTNAGERS
jgi:hypothetical protein